MKLKNKKHKKSPILAAVFNFILPGLGYIYAGKRIAFGTGIFILVISLTVLSFVDVTLASIPSGDFDLLYTIIAFAFSFLFAYDGYQTAK